MKYEDFKEELQQEILARSLRHIEFLTETMTKANETLEGLVIKFEGQSIAPTIYPQKMYESYMDGASVSEIVDYISPSIFSTIDYPKMPELTVTNAEKSISFSLLNKEKNAELMAVCPYKEVHDMIAIPRWHISDNASFVVTNYIAQQLKMTKEEVLVIAQKNTEKADYSCERIDSVMKEAMLNEGIDEEVIDEFLSMEPSPLHVITNKTFSDGSCAILSKPFMQKVSEQLENEELFILPSSRHEMLVVNPNIIGDPSALKLMVMDVNNDPSVIRSEDFLSNSIYKYNVKTHDISMCDSKGFFHDKGTVRSAEQGISRRGKGIC